MILPWGSTLFRQKVHECVQIESMSYPYGLQSNDNWDYFATGPVYPNYGHKTLLVIIDLGYIYNLNNESPYL